MQFANDFPDKKIVSALTTQLSWTHSTPITSVKTQSDAD
jgi:hypothetical protein